MRQLNRQFFSQNKSGFTLIEVVLALFVTSLIILLLSDSLGLVKKINKKTNDGNQIAFCYTQLTRFLEDDGGFKISLENSTEHKIVVLKPNLETEPNSKTEKSDLKFDKPKETYKSYTIERYGNMLRVRGLNSGHMPLLLQIKQATFDFDEEKFAMKIVEKDKRASELFFKATIKESPKEDKVENDQSKDTIQEETNNKDAR